MPLHSSFLSQRGILHISGEERFAFLQGLITNDIHFLQDHKSLWTGFLTPQGKYLFDFIITEKDDALLLDVDKMFIDPLLATLKAYKLRSRVEFKDLSDILGVGVVWSHDFNHEYTLLEGFQDPRHSSLGYRFICSLEELEGKLIQLADLENPYSYRSHRIHCGVSEIAEDFCADDLYWLEVNSEKLHGISFQKGCYVGQEVTARMKHKEALKRQIIPVSLKGWSEVTVPCPLQTDVWDVGTLIAISGDKGLALVRLDRWKDAESSMRSVMAGNTFVLRRHVPWENS
jgi:tRNA-modifying protein YgfZ